MGSYFNYIGVNYFHENINDLYTHIFVSKLIKICKLSNRALYQCYLNETASVGVVVFFKQLLVSSSTWS